MRTGIGALGKDIDAAIVQLGDMPGVGAALLDRLMAAFSPVEGRSICVPTVAGKRGNPVLWDRRFFAEIAKVSGDTGAKHLIGEHADLVCEVEMSGRGGHHRHRHARGVGGVAGARVMTTFIAGSAPLQCALMGRVDAKEDAPLEWRAPSEESES